MKILHIIPTYYPAYSRGGPIWSVHSLNKSLVKRGVDVTVYTTNLDQGEDLRGNKTKEKIVDGIKVFYFPISFKPWQYSKKMRKALSGKTKDFDLVHITSTFLSVSALGAYYSKKAGAPYIISPRGNLMKEPLARKSPLKKKIYIQLVERRNLEKASAIHFTTKAEEKEYIETGLSFKKSVQILNGMEVQEDRSLDVENFKKKYSISGKSKVVLSLGRLNWEKGFDTLIPAFSRILKKASKVILMIAGPDERGYKKEIKKLIKKNKLPTESIIFTGQLLGEEKRAAFASADVFVLPSYSENFGMAVVEAMSFGLPVIITEGVGISPEIKESAAGVVVQKDKDQVAKAIIDVLGNPESAKEMGEKGKRLVREKFSMDKVAESFLKAYSNIIEEYNGQNSSDGNNSHV